MPKSPDAFRTISEVADWLGVQAHVLRFWESKFAQVKPIKRAGGRRYYRPADMLLLGGIKKVLHDDGLTIKGAQKLLREKGIAHVADLSQPLEDTMLDAIDGTAVAIEDEAAADLNLEAAEAATSEDDTEEVAEAQEDQPDTVDALPDSITGLTFSDVRSDEEEAGSDVAPAAEEHQENVAVEASTSDIAAEAPAHLDAAPDGPSGDFEADEPAVLEEAWLAEPAEDAAPETPVTEEDAEPEPQTAAVEEQAEEETPMAMPSFRARARTPAPAPAAEEIPDASDADDAPVAAQSDVGMDDTPQADAEIEDQEAAAEPPRPKVVEVPQVPPASEIKVDPSLLSALGRIRQITPEHAREIKPLLARLTRLRASMANPRKESHKD